MSIDLFEADDNVVFDYINNVNETLIIKKNNQYLCMICSDEEIDKNDLIHHCCGRESCESVVCTDCIVEWFHTNEKGKFFNIRALCCPFCSLIVPEVILYRFNRDIETIYHSIDLLSDEWHYSWCKSCNKLKESVRKECSQDIPIHTNFVCLDCNPPFIKPNDAKRCPSCEEAIIKLDGCDHIECICGKHFCWKCADVSYDTSLEVYQHMDRKHGSITYTPFNNREYDNLFDNDPFDSDEFIDRQELDLYSDEKDDRYNRCSLM